MNIQSFSLSVPAKCPNKCRFCVAHMHEENYIDQLNCNMPFYDLYLEDFEQRLLFTRDNGCNTVMITSSGEALGNRQYLALFGLINKKMEKPYRNIELQTSGVFLNEGYLRFLRNHVWVKTISLSLANMFDDDSNADIMQIPEKLRYKITELCGLIKKYDFTLRLSLNISDVYNDYTVEEIIKYAKDVLGADQLTIRKLYTSGNNTPEDEWIKTHAVREKKLSGGIMPIPLQTGFFDEFYEYVTTKGTALRQLDFGETVYSCYGLSIVIDGNCMATGLNGTAVKYLILRENCKLYSHWSDEGSLVF